MEPYADWHRARKAAVNSSEEVARSDQEPRRARIIDLLGGDRFLPRWLLRSTILLVVLVHVPPAYALDPARTLTQYVHRIWQVQQGLPQASIYAILQTHDRYLWLGTQTGLVTFDGVRFTAVDEMDGVSMANIWVTHLLEDEGTLWIGTSQDGLIALRNGKVTRYSRQNGLPSDTVQCLLADGRGNVWVCTPKGLAEFSGEKVRVVAPAPDLSAPDIRTACLMPDGALIVGTDTGSIATWDGTPFAAWRRRVPESATVQAMLCSTAGTL